MSSRHLKNIVLITGANQGIGYQIAKKLASSEYPDYYVLLGSRDLEKGGKAATEIGGKNISAIQIDVTDRASIAAAKEKVDQEYGKLDVLINNAGVLTDLRVDASYPLGRAMQDAFATNVSGVADTIESFAPLLKKAEIPRIVMVSSRAGSLSYRSEQHKTYTTTKFVTPAYDCSKAALNMLTLYYTNAYGEGWKINASCPGFRPTNLSNFDENAGSIEEGALNAVRLATLGKDGESGTFSNLENALSW
ncbi:hypothetical protein MBLNU459_g0831t1 [Dothideomycetes sp. NU459]